MNRRVLTLPVVAALCFVALTLCVSASAQEHSGHAAAAKAKPIAALMAGYGTWHHPVSTKNAQV